VQTGRFEVEIASSSHAQPSDLLNYYSGNFLVELYLQWKIKYVLAV
jgi:hypothetical protein